MPPTSSEPPESLLRGDEVMEIVAPKWGVTMDEAGLVTWLRKVVDKVEEDKPVAEMETDKANGEIVSHVTGRITDLLVADGARI